MVENSQTWLLRDKKIPKIPPEHPVVLFQMKIGILDNGVQSNPRILLGVTSELGQTITP